MPEAFVVIEMSWSFCDRLAFDTMMMIALRGNAGPKIFPILPTNLLYDVCLLQHGKRLSSGGNVKL
jgi:hypothetical protein